MADRCTTLNQSSTMLKTFPYRYRVLILLFFLILITYLDRVCISLVGVRIKSEFNLNNEEFGWVLAAFSLAYALFEIPSGILGDRIGQRAVLMRIVIWWSIFTVLTGATSGLVSLIAVRFLFGAGEAGAFPTSSGVVSRWFPVSETGRSLSALFVGQNTGAALAPLLVVPVAAAFGWRASFMISGVIGLLWVLVCFAWFRNNPSEMKGISEAEQKLIEENRRFVAERPTFPWRTALTNRSLLALIGSFFCSQWGLYFFIAWMPVYLQEGRHFSESEMKMITFYTFIFGIIGTLSAGFLSDWWVKRKGLLWGRRVIGVLALSLMAVSFLAAALTANNVLVVICLYSGLLFYPFNVIASFATCVDIGGNRVGTVVGMMNFFGQTGAFFLVILFGKIVDVTQSFNAPLFVLAVVLFIGSMLWLLVSPFKSINPT